MFTIKKRFKKLASISLAISIMLTMLLFSSCTEEEIAYYKDMRNKELQSQASSNDSSSSEVVSDKETQSSVSKVPQSSKQQDISSTSSKNKTSSSIQASSRAPTSSQKPSSSKSNSTSRASSNTQYIPSSSPQVNQNDMKAIEDRIIQMVNELRASVGVAPLAKNNKLSQSAYMRSKEMLQTGQFSHTRPDGSSCFTAIQAVGYNYMTVGENIGWAKGHAINTIAQVMFDGWKNSPGHYANMVKADFKEIGVSVCTDGTAAYATQHFGTQR